MPGALSSLAGAFGSTIPAAAVAGSQPLASTPALNITAPNVHPTFFGPGGTGRKIAGFVGDALYALGGGNPVALHESMRRSALEDQQSQLDTQLKQLQIGALTRKAGQPQVEHVGDSFGIIDPDTGGFTPTYTAPTDGERYALSIGAQRGTPQWMTALQDYALRGNGPTALGFDKDLEGTRQQDRVDLEKLRQGNRTALKGVATYGQLHPRIPGGPVVAGGGGAGLSHVSSANLLSQLGG